MSDLIVQSYRARWNTREKTGFITLHVFGALPHNPFLETTQGIEVDDAEEMHLLLDILRNEKPLRYNRSTGELYTSNREPIGEAEE
ncbi:MAG: hypothetical protein AAFQ43_08465 [Bacteroidota bacterium]